MRRIKTILDYIFIAVVAFLFFCVWCNFHYRSIKKTFIPAILLTILFMALMYLFLQYRREKNAAKIKSEKEAQATFLELMHIKSPDVLIKKAYKGECFVYCRICKDCISEQDIINSVAAAKKADKTCVAFFCETASNKIQFISRNYANFKIEFFDYVKIYNLLKNANLLPPKTIEFSKKKINFKEFFGLMLAPERSRSYFFISLFLTFTCLFTPYKIYYALFSTFFFVMAIVSKFKKPKTA